MGNALPGLLADWIGREPVAGLFLAVTAVLLFGSIITSQPGTSSSLQTWVRRLINALLCGLLFLGMSGAFQFLLDRDYMGFSEIYGSFTRQGSLSNIRWNGWRSRYGGQVVQSDLVVTPAVWREVVESIPPADPLGRVLYRNTLVEEIIAENLITGFAGDLELDMVNPENPTDGFNAYALTADYHYRIKNPLQEDVYARFIFPIPEAGLCRDIRVLLDEVEIPFLVNNNRLSWEKTIGPGEQISVSIHYFLSGMDYFVFEIPEPRQVRDFTLRLAINSDASGLIMEPEGAISTEVADRGAGKLVTWRIVDAIAAPRMGTYMTQGWPYSPFHSLLVVLPYAAKALLFFLSLATLTLLIARIPIDLWQLAALAALAALFCIPFLILMSGLPRPAAISPDDWDLWQVRMLPLLAVIPVIPGYLVLRGIPSFARLLILMLMVLFVGVYPLSGTIPDEQRRNAILGGVQAGMIFYIFAYTLYIRVRAPIRK